MNKDGLQKIVNDATNDVELKSEEIPAIDLYVDQILNLVAESTKKGSERYHDKQLTKTMVNNYSKEGLLTPIKGKKYDKEQILQILLIYSLKSTISIGEIKRLLDGMYETEGFDVESLTRTYDRYLEIKDDNRAQVAEVVNRIIERNALDISNDLDYIILVATLTAFSAHLKNIAQEMIDEKFPEMFDVYLESDANRDSKYDRKREKITAKGELKLAKGEAKVAKAEAKVAKGEAKVARAEAKVVKVEAKTGVKIARVETKKKLKEKEE